MICKVPLEIVGAETRLYAAWSADRGRAFSDGPDRRALACNFLRLHVRTIDISI